MAVALAIGAFIEMGLHVFNGSGPGAIVVALVATLAVAWRRREPLAVAGGLNRFATGDQLASAAGLAPALQQSGKVRYLQRATSGDRTLKMIFYQSAFCALQRDAVSRAYYDRKRREGKTHHQAVIALARRRINVLHAILRSRQPYRQPAEQAAA